MITVFYADSEKVKLPIARRPNTVNPIRFKRTWELVVRELKIVRMDTPKETDFKFRLKCHKLIDRMPLEYRSETMVSIDVLRMQKYKPKGLMLFSPAWFAKVPRNDDPIKQLTRMSYEDHALPYHPHDRLEYYLSNEHDLPVITGVAYPMCIDYVLDNLE
jgi:hypothetical protein